MLGRCGHAEVKKVYIARHNEAMKMIMKLITTGTLGNYFCVADVGTRTAMAGLGAAGTRLPDWHITETTMQRCDFPPADKHKLRPDCIIVEFPEDEVPGQPLRSKRSAEGQERTVRTHSMAGRQPKKIWVVEVGYSADTRYTEKMAKKQSNT